MEVLYILNDGPSEDADYLISLQSVNHIIKVVDLSKSKLSYEELVDLIERYDKVYSW